MERNVLGKKLEGNVPKQTHEAKERKKRQNTYFFIHCDVLENHFKRFHSIRGKKSRKNEWKFSFLQRVILSCGYAHIYILE